VTGLAWTPTGGDILFIESRLMPGSGKLTLTGQLGDVMRESTQIALSLVRSSLPSIVPGMIYSETDIHVHVPQGSIPKDGPSAGVAMLTSLASLLTGLRLDSKIAMTGEITLRGQVMPVGGIKEKVIAAHRSGVTTLILPKRNEADLDDVPEDIRSDLTIHFVETIEEVLNIALGLDAGWLHAPILDAPRRLSSSSPSA
jgi:ATP-dependent Lon protease